MRLSSHRRWDCIAHEPALGFWPLDPISLGNGFMGPSAVAVVTPRSGDCGGMKGLNSNVWCYSISSSHIHEQISGLRWRIYGPLAIAVVAPGSGNCGVTKGRWTPTPDMIPLTSSSHIHERISSLYRSWSILWLLCFRNSAKLVQCDRTLEFRKYLEGQNVSGIVQSFVAFYFAFFFFFFLFCWATEIYIHI